MPVIKPQQLQPRYDAIVIGSGAAGGQSAYTLTMEGAKVLMLEAGRHYDAVQETPMFQTNRQAPLRGTDTPDKPFGFYDATVGGGWQVPGEPYTQASDDPQKQFWWWRSRMLGGRTNHWSRVALRNGPYDFKPRTRDGLGFDWPIAYDDVHAYYDKVELLIGVYGTNEGIENVPHSSPGVLHDPPKPRVGELLVRERGKKLGLPVVPAHRAVMTRRLDPATLPQRLHPGNARAQKILAEDIQSRAACFWATPCGRGCSIRATYQSTTVHLPPALATGNLDLLPDAMVREITVDGSGRATGVVFIDKQTGTEYRVVGRTVILGAGSCESVRLLLNSRSARHPQGLGNSSGRLGRYVMDTVGGGFGGQIPLLENMPAHNEDGAGGAHMYIPWWLCQEQLAGKLGFARGYHVEFRTGRGEPTVNTGANLEWLTGGSYGKKFKEDARRYFGSFVSFAGRGEMIPNEKSFCEIDPVVKDKWGIPVLRFHWEWSEHETRQAAHMERTFADLIAAMGGRPRSQPTTDGARAIKPGGSIIHEVGGAMMGAEAASSVTNAWGQLWDSPNVIVADGAVFASNPDKNPTLTIMALAWRAADHLLEEMKQGRHA